MFNPLAILFRYYNPLHSPVIVHRCTKGLLLVLQSPLRRSRSSYIQFDHTCGMPPAPPKDVDGVISSTSQEEVGPLPQVRILARDHEITIFASDAVMSVSHRAPKAYFSDEIALYQSSGWGPDQRMPREDRRWVGPVLFSASKGPLGFSIDSAARQAEGLATYRAELARKQTETEHTHIQ